MPLHQSLTYIKSKVEEIINDSRMEIYLDSIAKDDVKEGVYVSLLYAEEEKTLKNNDYMQTYYDDKNPKQIMGYRKVNPKIFLNLYVLILSTHSPYDEALKQISSIISGFRKKNVFVRQKDDTGKDIDDFGKNNYPKLNKLILDLHTLSFEQNNSLWQTIGSKLYPYIVYKVTMIAYAEEMTKPDTEPVKKVLELVKPITENLKEGSDPSITDKAITDDEKAQKAQMVDDVFQEMKLGDKSVIVINSKEVYDNVKTMLNKTK